MAGARKGDISESEVEQVGTNFGIGMDQDALGDEALSAVAGYGVAVVEMAMLDGVEFDLPSTIESRCNSAFRTIESIMASIQWASPGAASEQLPFAQK